MVPFEQSTLQHLSVLVRNKIQKNKFYPLQLQNALNFERKKFIPIYAEDLHFLITEAG